ncbi:MAG: hypothetical protein NXI24_24060 [bacterium]|nr:hypothetical protein [bacterium]
MNAITIAREKKEFIQKHLTVIGIEDAESMTLAAIQSSRILPFFYFCLAIAASCGLLLFAADLGRYGEALIDRTGYYLDRESVLFLVRTLLILTLMISALLFDRSRRARIRAQRDLKTLRILVDYMRIGNAHFVEILSDVFPQARESEREFFSERVFRVST